MNTLLRIIAFFSTVIVTTILQGFVLSKLWAWFIMPIFQTEPLRVVESVGILTFVAIFNMRYDKKAYKSEFWKAIIERMIFVLTICAYILLFGWIVSLYM
jgi:hypothetical protein